MDRRTSRNNDIKRAIDAQFSGVAMDYSLQNRVLQRVREEGEVVVKRKRSVGLVLVIVLIVAMATALAVALLSPREIIEEHGVPIANQSEGDFYSVEETNILLELAKENGIALSQAAMASINQFLSHGEGYYKEELLRELAKAEFGPAPQRWTLEQQKWYDDVWVALGLADQPQKAIPGENEISQEQALQMAEDYIHAQYDSAVNLRDTAVYQTGVQYLDGHADGEYPGRYWTIFYESQTIDAASYSVYLNSQGEVWNATVIPRAVKGDNIEAIIDTYRDVFGPYEWQWSQEELRIFQEAALQSRSTHHPLVLCFTKTVYPDISPDAISAEEAAAIVAEALKAQGIDGAVFGDDIHDGATLIGDEPNAVWKVRLSIEGFNEEWKLVQYDVYCAEVDSMTGEIKNTIVKYYGSDKRWYYNVVLEKVYDEVESTWVEPPSTNG